MISAAVRFLSTAELIAGLDAVRESPKNDGMVLLVEGRPGVNERELLDEAALDCVDGAARPRVRRD